jgi:hypothetical protein
MNSNLRKLIELLTKYIDQNDNLFFPDGSYGGECYYLEKEGFHGPYRIPDYVVPVKFSSKAEKKFLTKLEEAGLKIDDAEIETLEKLCDWIDLSYGDQRWELEPYQFVDMLMNGCEADNLYLPSEWDYGDFHESCTSNLIEHPFVEWESLADNNHKLDIDDWVIMLNDSLTNKSNQSSMN